LVVLSILYYLRNLCSSIRNLRPSPTMDKWVRAKGKDEVFVAKLEAKPAETTNLRKQDPEINEKLLKLHEKWLKSVESGCPR